MSSEIETSTASPVYVRIASALRERIDAGDLLPDMLVPSERELGRAFGVSRMTARHALGVLENEGRVYRRPPRGTFVAQPRLPMRIGSFSEEVVRLGRRPTAELLWAESQLPTPLAAQTLDLPDGARVHALQRLRRADGEAIAIETTYFPADRTPGLLKEALDGSLWSILRRHHGITATRAAASLEVVTLDDLTARQLGLRNTSPGILLTRRTFDAADRCFEFARDLYRADRVEFQVDALIPAAPDDGQPSAVRPPKASGQRGRAASTRATTGPPAASTADVQPHGTRAERPGITRGR